MDTRQLEKQVREITELQDSIKQTSSYCSTYPDSAGMVVFIIENEFISARRDRKKLYLFLIHQIIQDEKTAKRMDHPYVKQFGGKLKKLIQDYAQYEHIQFSQVDDIVDLEKAYAILKRWEKDQIYHPLFLDKLRAILQPKFDQLKMQQLYNSQISQSDLASNKILVQNLSIIQQFDQTYKLYLHLKGQRDTDFKYLDFNTNFDKYAEKVERDKAEDYEIIDELIDQGESVKSYLNENICSIQNNYLELARQGEEMIKILSEQENEKIDYYRLNRPTQ